MSQSFGMKSCTCSVLQGKASVQNQILRTLTPGAGAGSWHSALLLLSLFEGKTVIETGCTLCCWNSSLSLHIHVFQLRILCTKQKQNNKKEQPKAQISAQKSSQCLPLAGTQAAGAESMLGASSCCELTRCTF